MTEMCPNEKKRVLLWGGRSKARIVCHRLSEDPDIESVTIFDNTLAEIAFEFSGRHITDMAELRATARTMTHFVVCIGGEHGYARVMTARAFEKIGLRPVEIVSRPSYIDSTSTRGVGNHIMPSSTIHCFSSIGDYCIINTRSSIDHDCRIGDGVHVMGAAAIAGNVEIGDYATIGTNATILPNLKIGTGAFVGAGAVVTRDVAEHSVVTGVPARETRKNEYRFSQELIDQLTA